MTFLCFCIYVHMLILKEENLVPHLGRPKLFNTRNGSFVSKLDLDTYLQMAPNLGIFILLKIVEKNSILNVCWAKYTKKPKTEDPCQ